MPRLCLLRRPAQKRVFNRGDSRLKVVTLALCHTIDSARQRNGSRAGSSGSSSSGGSGSDTEAAASAAASCDAQPLWPTGSG